LDLYFKFAGPRSHVYRGGTPSSPHNRQRALIAISLTAPSSFILVVVSAAGVTAIIEGFPDRGQGKASNLKATIP
jgi:hypothetical protein